MIAQLLRFCAVIALVTIATALATPEGRLPLAVRGLAKMFRISGDERKVTVWKRALAFSLVVAAVCLALI